MHDPRVLRDDLAALREGMRRRGALEALEPAIARSVALDGERRALIHAVEERKASRNALTLDIGRRKKNGDDATELLTRSRALGDEIEALESTLRTVDAELAQLLLELPNIPLDDVPAGGAEHNATVREWGAPREGGTVLPHWEIGTRLGLLDLERGAKVAGSGFIVFRGAGARLVRALLNFMLDLHTGEHGYDETWVPAVVNRASMTGTGNFPKFEDDAYALRDEDMFLIPTAEVPVTNLYRDEIIAEAALPMAFAAYSPCFRREAGSHGRDTRGLLRVHQFDKVELVRYATPERSREEHQLLTSHAERVLQLLELPYRVLLLAAGDTGFSSAMTYDLEVFAPGVDRWLEVSSSSNFTDFQARRTNLRYRPAGGGKPRLLHTLNASGVAFPRVIAAILEHHQRPDGTVAVPAALRPYVGAESLG